MNCARKRAHTHTHRQRDIHSESDATGYLRNHTCETHTPQSMPLSIFTIHFCTVTSMNLNATNHLSSKFIKMHFHLKWPVILKSYTADQRSMYHIHFRPTMPNIFLCQWVPVTTAWRVFRLQIKERPPIRRVAANKLNKQSRTADEGWSSSLGVGRGANNPSLLKLMFRNTHKRDDSSGDKTIRR